MNNLIVKEISKKLYIFTILISIFAISCSSKKIKNNYYIERFDEGETVYYICERGVDSGGGVFDGIIKEVALDKDYIYANVQRLASSDKGGWYRLNIKTGQIQGPIDLTNIHNIKILSASDFFNSL